MTENILVVVNNLVRELARYRPSAVLPGTEIDVIVADLVTDALGLPGNDPATSVARRDKYEMHNSWRGTSTGCWRGREPGAGRSCSSRRRALARIP